MIKILAIDDNNDNLISLKAIIEDSFPDSVLFTALNGLDGIDLAIANDPDVVLLDVVMPEMDGFEVCRRLKSNVLVQNIPVIFLTALGGDRRSRIKALEVGAEAFLSKPIDETELMVQLRAMTIVKQHNEQKKNEKKYLTSLVEERTRELNESHEMLIKLTDRVPGVVYQYRLFPDGKSCFPYSSPGMFDIYGLTPEEVKEDASPVFNRIHPDDYEMIVSSIQESAQNLSHYFVEYRVILPGHGIGWRLSDAKPERMEDGSTLWYGIISDITERKKAEDLLRESEYFFKESQRAAFVGSYSFDLFKDFWTASEVLEQIFGIDKNYTKTLDGWLEIAHPDDREMMARYFSEEVVGKRKSFNKEYRIVRKSDGETRWVLGLGKLSFDEDGQIVMMMGTIQDITERILVRSALDENEEKYKQLFEANADSIAIFQIDPDYTVKNFIDCNENNAKLLGYTKEEILELDPNKIEVQVSKKQFLRRKAELITNGQTDFETKLIHKSGRLVDVEIKAKLIKIRNQSAIMNISRDITKRKHQEESLRQSNELNESLLRSIPFGMDIVDEEGNILFISENLRKHVVGQAEGQKCWELYKDDAKQCKECPLHRGIKIGETAINESDSVLGGKIFQISHTGLMFQGRKAMLEIFQDITEKKEVEKRVKLLAHSLESISECVSVTDNNDKIIYVNKSFLHTYGYEADELIGQHTAMLRPPDMTFDHVRNILPETIEGGWRGEIMNRRKDGSLFPILLSTSIIKDDQDTPIALIGVAIDITEMRRSRAELIAAKEQAEESNHLKSAFLNNMSHEIRTPMNHIMGFSSLMAEADGEEKDAYADIILNSSNQLLSLIENVMLLSRLQSEKIEVEKHDFSPEVLIANISKNFERDQLKNNVTLKCGIPEEYRKVIISSDMEKIKQILINLTSNAIKYTFEGSIELGFEIRSEKISFYVKDTGIGIPRKEIQKIFDSFYRTEQVISMVIGGTGLGLSIVKELVNSMDGTIEVESEPGKGSRFSFTIPLEQSVRSVIEDSRPASSPRPMKDMTLLVADDEVINFQYLEILLKNNVKKMDHAINGREAVEMASKAKYDMILMDLKMPGMDGFEATRRLKSNFPTIPIIAQTAYATMEDKEEATLAGCDDFIAKPIKKEILFEMIQKNL